MEKKNMVLLTVIAVATLLVAVVGATFAYFTATVQDTRDSDKGQGTANITAGSVASKTVVGNVEQAAGKFTATGVYPGHKEIAGLSVTVTNGDAQNTSNTNIDIVYNVTTNTFAQDEIEVNVYKKTEEEVTIPKDYFGCTHDVQDQLSGNEFHFTEKCNHELDDLVSDLSLEKLTDEPIKLKGASTTEKDLVLATDTINVTGSSQGETVYYYVVVEFKDTGLPQNNSMNAQLEGKIDVKAA